MKVKNLITCVSIGIIVVLGILFFNWQNKHVQIQELKTMPVDTINIITPVLPKADLSTIKTIGINSSQPIPVDSSLIRSINSYAPTNTSGDDVINVIESQAPNLNREILKLSLTAYEHAQKKGVASNQLLTIVDYSKPSTERRLWVIDLTSKKVLFNTWVAHGKNSGNVNSSSFSNSPESLKSSIGVFVTTDIYSGKHGNSLHVQGLESGFNDNAYKRSIVFHGADYVSESIAQSGRLGRSWGCWAVSQNVIASLIKTIKNGSLVVAYYPDKKWLNQSTFLN